MKTLKKRTKVAAIASMDGRIMERIHAENIEIKPASLFILKNLAVGFAICAFATLGIFFVSMIFFRLTALHIFGLRFVFAHLPWFSIGLAISCLFSCFALIEYYKVAYKLSLFKLMALLTFVFAVLGFLTYKTQIHTKLQTSQLGGIYTVEEKPMQVYAGRVIETRTQRSFVLETLRGDRLKIYVTDDTRLPKNGIEFGQSLLVAGYTQSGNIIAKGILLLGSKK